MPSIRLQEITRTYLGFPFTQCIHRKELNYLPPTHIVELCRRNLTRISTDDTFQTIAGPAHNNYDSIKCKYKRLHHRIYAECDCILRYIEDIGEFFETSTEHIRNFL